MNNTEQVRQYYKKRPWVKVYSNAKQRCTNPNDISYKNYGGRGIGFYLTVDMVEKIWFRDKAYLMDHPSIDRENNDYDYTFSNCRFIEKSENSRRSMKANPRRSKKRMQYDRSGNYIATWVSAEEAGRQLGLQATHIRACCLGKQKTCGGFIWVNG